MITHTKLQKKMQIQQLLPKLTKKEDILLNEDRMSS